MSESGVLEKGEREKICSETRVNWKRDSLDLSLIEGKSWCEKNTRKLWKRKLGKVNENELMGNCMQQKGIFLAR